MRPKSLPLTIAGVLFLALGTGLIGVGVGLPDWTEFTHPAVTKENVGLFERCIDGQGCDSREDESGILSICIEGVFFCVRVNTSAYIRHLSQDKFQILLERS